MPKIHGIIMSHCGNYGLPCVFYFYRILPQIFMYFLSSGTVCELIIDSVKGTAKGKKCVIIKNKNLEETYEPPAKRKNKWHSNLFLCFLSNFKAVNEIPTL